MKCQKCGTETFLPFRCPYCGGYFCTEHRLPENHECPKIESARAPTKEEQPQTSQGLILTAISIVSPRFKIISPGAVVISGLTSKRNIGKISIAGPLTNILLSIGFLLVALSIPVSNFAYLLLLGFAINGWIAFLNLIPFGILDGFKVFFWNKIVWALAFTISLILTIASYMLL